MADRHTNRDVRGRFVRTGNARESGDGKFETYTEMPVEIQGADPADLAFKMVGRDDSNAGPRYAAPKVADNLGVEGSRLRARRPEMVSPVDADHSLYGKQGAVLRTAARDSGPDDPTPYLVGLEPSRLTGAE